LDFAKYLLNFNVACLPARCGFVEYVSSQVSIEFENCLSGTLEIQKVDDPEGGSSKGQTEEAPALQGDAKKVSTSVVSVVGRKALGRPHLRPWPEARRLTFGRSS